MLRLFLLKKPLIMYNSNSTFIIYHFSYQSTPPSAPSSRGTGQAQPSSEGNTVLIPLFCPGKQNDFVVKLVEKIDKHTQE
jgi:hypothetical protein